jgi:cytochrome c-type biogenesis protein CcmH
MRASLPIGVFLIALSMAPGGVAAAQSSVDAAAAEAEAQALFREVMSPFCPGLTLADCPSPNAFTLRDEIEARLKQGESRDAIVDELVAKYGTPILADPSETPIGSVVWGVPIALSALAALGLAWFLRRATRPPAEEPLAVAGPPGLRDRLEEELDKLD